MKKKPQQALCLYDADGVALFRASAYEMRLEPATVNALSDEFFGDPNPCYIHQSAVSCRAADEIELALKNKGRVRLDSLPDTLRRYFSGYPNCWECEITE